MKKHILVLGILLVALLFVFVPQAHAGVGNTHSGGSSTIHSGGGGGGSSWSGGSSSYSSSSGTDSGGIAVVAIIGLVGFVYNLAKEANESDDSSYSNNGPKWTTEERAGRPIENNYEAIRRIR